MPRESLTHQRERAQKIEERLFAYYGEGASSLDWETPYQLTVAVVLAAQCSDAAVNKVTPRLWQSYPEPQDLAAAPLEEIEEHLRTIGLFRTKAARIKELAQLVTTEYGGTVPHDIDLLQRLPGVGRKTANCVMCEAFKDPQGIAWALPQKTTIRQTKPRPSSSRCTRASSGATSTTSGCGLGASFAARAYPAARSAWWQSCAPHARPSATRLNFMALLCRVRTAWG
jgi:hypothetical protein